MAIAFGSAGTRLLVGTAGTAWAVPYPATVNADDLLVLHIVTNGGAVTAPAGWTVIYNEATVVNPRGGLFIKKAAGTEGGTTLAVTTASTTGNAQIFSYTGVDPATPQDVAATSVSLDATTDTTVDLPSLTTVTAGALLVYAAGANSGSVTMTGPAGSTERVDHGALGGTGTKAGALYDEPMPVAGSTGTTRIITLSAGRAYWGALLALRPAPTITLSPAGVPTAEAFADPVLAATLTTLPEGIASTEGAGAPTVTVQDLSQTASPAGIASAGAFGSPKVMAHRLVSPPGIASLQAFGRPKQTNILVTRPAKLPPRVTAFGAPTVRIMLTAAPRGIASKEAVGQAVVRSGLVMRPVGMGRYESFGAPKVVGGSGITPYEVLGTMTTRRYSGRLGDPENTATKPHPWEGTLG